ncbi:MAG TPA: AraC family transcriptional regulator [Polyangiaceae bacterium]|nr:AraC family transcriptional regulator [Polyangiaceae bacterium]
MFTDERVWSATDLPGETIAIGNPTPELQVMSARGSQRNWTEVHTSVTIAAVAPGQPLVEARWKTRARSLSSTAGTLMAIEPGDVHVTHKVTSPAAFDVVRFDPALLEDAMLALDRPGTFHFRAPAVNNPVVLEAIHALVRVHAQNADAFEVESASAELVTKLVDELSELPSPSGVMLDPVRDFRLRRARDYLREHLAEKPSLDELAREVGMSKYRLCAVFKSTYGVSPGQYWAARRISEACRMLLRGMPIRRVAQELGFVDEAFFTRMFRKHRGCPPGAWVALHRANSKKGAQGEGRVGDLLRRRS